MLADGFAEEVQGCCGIPFSRQQKVDGLTFGIDRPVQIFRHCCTVRDEVAFCVFERP